MLMMMVLMIMKMLVMIKYVHDNFDMFIVEEQVPIILVVVS